jgi:hypothetical protein
VTGRRHESRAPLGAGVTGRLEVVRAPSPFTLGVASDPSELYSACFDGIAPMVFAADGRLTIEYPRLSLPSSRGAATVLLNPAIPWELSFRSGISRLRADLRELQATAFEVGGGVDDSQILFSEPAGAVRVAVGGGASRLTVLRPAGAAVVLRIQGGATRLALDGERYGSIGGETQLESPGGGRPPHRFEIEIHGGAARLTVAEHAGGAER